MDANINIGKLIRQVRKSSHMTQETLAEKSDLSVNFVSRIERTDNQNVSWKNIEAMANAMGLTVLELLQVNEEKTQKQGLYLTKLLSVLEGMDDLKSEELCKNIIEIICLLEERG